jgi:branched-chain amino acid aminotransferase
MHHCWFNGKIAPTAETKMAINDLGLLRGYGLFDYFRTYNLKPFQWDWYWERYERSAKMLRLHNPIYKDDAFETVQKLVALQGDNDCAIRFLLTGGYSNDSISAPSPNLIIQSEDLHHSSIGDYESGIKVISYEYVRDLPDVKSIDYKHFMVLQDKIRLEGASDVLFYKNGEISELSRSNVFIINSQKLITPDQNILHGITRRTVLELAHEDFEIEIRPVTLVEMLAAEEVFTTSTTKRVLPISQIDDKVIGNGKCGPKTRYLLGRINDLVEGW